MVNLRGTTTGVRSVLLVLLALLIMTGTGLIAPGTAVAAPQVHKLTGRICPLGSMV